MFRRRWPAVVLVTCALALAGVGWLELNRASAKGFYGTALDTPVQVEEFTRTSAACKATLSDWRGKYRLVFFGFTECPDVCPLTMGRLAKIYRDLGEPEGVQVVMVSVDPETDTPARVQHYVESFHLSFVGLTGSTSDLVEAARTFFVGYRQLGEGVSDTDYVTLLDRDGKLHLGYAQDKVPLLGEDLGAILKRGRL